MKKLIIILTALMMACNIQAQEQKDSIVYRYIIAEPVGGLFSGKCKLRIDDGMNFARVRDDNDKKITFKSCAAALMFLTSQGWELVDTYTNISIKGGMGMGGSGVSTYWILRKPSTKEEVTKIVDASLEEKQPLSKEDIYKMVQGK